MILMFYWLTVAFASDYEVVQPKFGFYIENLGTAQVKRGNLRLQVSFPIAEILHDRENVENTWKRIKEMCEQTEKITTIARCKTLFEHLSIRKLHLLKSTDEVLKYTEQKNRRRRGLFGKFLTSVFGVNDEVYREIEDLHHNQHKILQFTNQEVLLINARLNQTNFAIVEKLKRFDDRLIQVIKSINEMARWYTSADHNRISIEVISTYISAEDYFDEIQEKYVHWLNALHGHGHILDFITLQEINTSIQNISQKIGTQFLILPTPRKDVDMKVQNGTIILYGYLNIIERAVYSLIHVTPIPQTLKDNTIAVATIQFSTIAVNFDQQSYFYLKNEELRSCSEISKQGYLCSPTIIYNIDESPSCVIDEIYERHAKTKCEIKQLEVTGTIWKALAMKNTWLYITDQTRVVSVTCKGSRTEVHLNASGIINLADYCHLKTKEVTLKTSLDESVDVITSHTKNIGLNPANITFTKPPAQLQSKALIRADEQIIDYSQETKPHEVTLRRSLLYHSISTTSVIAIVILSLAIWRYWTSVKKMFTCCNLRCSPAATSSRDHHSKQQESLQHHFDRVLASAAGPQHVHA